MAWMQVLQKFTRSRQYLNASYQFQPGFIVSSREIILTTPGEVVRFTLRPDTQLLGNVFVTLTSNDTSVLSVTSPYTLQVDGNTQSNTKEVSLVHRAPGVAFVTLAPSGEPYGYTFSKYIRVVCKGSLFATLGSGGRGNSSVTSILLQRDEGLTLRLGTNMHLTSSSTSVNSHLTLNVHIESDDTNSPASLIADVSPTNLTLSTVSQALVLVTCRGIGHARLLIQVSDASEEVTELFGKVRRSIPIVCRPGIVVAFSALEAEESANFTPSFVSNLVRVQPNAQVALSILLDTFPTVRTELHVRNSAPSIVQMPSTIVMPPFTMHARVLTIHNLQGSSGDSVLTLSASSPGMLERFNEGCSGADAGRCTALFRDSDHIKCSFAGANATGGGKKWMDTMTNISAAAGGGVDCAQRQYRNCYRSACCASSEALACASAVVHAGCKIELLVPILAPELAEFEDVTSDFGVPAASAEQQEALYQSWVPGVNCEPHVACAFERCFPGKGNYEQVESHPLTIRALPGFGIEPPFLALQQGADQEITVILDRSVSTPVTVKLSIISDLTSGEPVAQIEPTQIVFDAGTTRSSPVTLKWMNPGRASLHLTTDFTQQPEAAEYSNVTQVLTLVISSSPGFVYSSHASTASGFEPGNFPVLVLFYLPLP